MKKTFLLSLMAGMACVFCAKAQVTTSPSPLEEDSEDVIIYFHADQGSKGLMNTPEGDKIYAHTGVITNSSKTSGDWQYTVADWDKNTTKCELIYEEPNLWSLHIGNIKEFYGIPNDPSIIIKQLAFVFRSADGKKEGKTSSGSDIFVDVISTGLHYELTSSWNSEIIDSNTGAVTFTLTSSENADLSILVNGTEIASKENTDLLTATYTFTEVGEYTVTAQVDTPNELSSKDFKYCYFSLPESKPYPGNNGVPVMGPVTNPDGSVTFCMAAPEMSRMIIIGSWNDYQLSPEQQMYYTDYLTTNPVTNESGTFRYFWVTIPDLGLTTDPYIYYFKVSGTASNGSGSATINTNTCDPYARLVLDPWNDKYINENTTVFPAMPEYPFNEVSGVPVAVYKSDINDYAWNDQDFVRPDKTNLIIYELLFRDFTGTEGEALGNGTVRQAIEKLEYLKTLGVNAIEVLPIYEFNGNISWGYNPNFYFAPDKAYGTPDDYKEFIDLCHQNGIAVILDMVFNQTDGLHPWLQMYGGTQYSPFYNVDAPHAYSVLNDWNQGYPLVQKQWEDVITYWLTEYHFDGFRFDLVKGLGTNDSYKNNGTDATNDYNASRVAEMKYLNGIIQAVSPGAYCINENLAFAKEENEMAADGEINWANVNYAACQFAMGWKEGSDMNRLYAPDDQRTPFSTVSYLESHDEQRLAYKQDQWAADGVKGNPVTSMQRLGSAAAQMIMTPGSHMIWMFSEMGNAENTKDGDNNITAPKIVNWDLLDEPNHRGLYDDYCQLIEIRNNNPQFYATTGSEFTIACAESNWNKGRYLYSFTDEQELLTFINPNTTGGLLTFSYDFRVKDNAAYKVLAKSYNSTSNFDAVVGSVSVPANCFVVIGSADLQETGVEALEIEKVKRLQVYGANGELVVYGEGVSTVYSLDGKVAGKVTGNGKIALPAGLYIVRNGKDSAKAVVY